MSYSSAYSLKLRNYPITFISLSGGGYRSTLFNAGVLRAFHHAKRLNKTTFVSAVSGGAIAASVWDAYLSYLPNDEFQKSNPLWPEKSLLSLIFNTPRLGGKYNWKFNKYTFRKSWAEYLYNWWENLSLELSCYERRYQMQPNTFIEMVDFDNGNLLIYFRDQIFKPDDDFFKYGEASFPCIVNIQTDRALAASTAFPVYFSPVVINNGESIVKLIDAGLVDNMAIASFLPIFESPNNKELLRKGDAWFLCEAGRAMSIAGSSIKWSFVDNNPIVKTLSITDQIFRLTGDIAQPIFKDSIINLINHYSSIEMSGVNIGMLPDGEIPWFKTNKISSAKSVANIKTGLFPIPNNDALAVIVQGAQVASYMLSMSNNERINLRNVLLSLKK